MGFINENISAENVVKYKLEEIDESFTFGGTYARDWTVNYEKKMYLRNVANGRGEERGKSEWIFYWRDKLIYLELVILESRGKPNDKGYIHWKLMKLERFEYQGYDGWLIMKFSDIISDIKDALLCYKDFGIYSVCTEFSFDLEIQII